MNRNRAKIIAAAVCLIAAGVVTLYNVGVFDTSARRQRGQPTTRSTDGSDAPPAGVLTPDDK